MNREQLLHWVEYNPRLIQDTLIRMIELPIENRASTQLDGEEVVRTILDNAHRFLKLNNIEIIEIDSIITEGDLVMAFYDRGDEIDPEDIPPQLSDADREKARNEDNN